MQLAALDIKGAFDSICWWSLLCHLQHIGINGLGCLSYLSEHFLYVTTTKGKSSVLAVSAGVPQGQYGHLYFTTFTFIFYFLLLPYLLLLDALMITLY